MFGEFSPSVHLGVTDPHEAVLVLRPATDSDVDAIRRWRNQPANREVSVHSHEITPDEHARWWSRARSDDSRQVLVYVHDYEPGGVVSFFDLDLFAVRPHGSWGFFLDADRLEERGQTLTAWIGVMRAATTHAFDHLGLADLHGEVLEHNTAVRQMNRRFGFTEGPPEHRVVDGREIVAVPIVLRAEDRRTGRRPA